MRWLLALVAWITSVAVLAPVCFFITMLLAGPHSSLLPNAVQPIVLVLGWATLLVAPIWIARVVWRKASVRLGPTARR